MAANHHQAAARSLPKLPQALSGEQEPDFSSAVQLPRGILQRIYGMDVPGSPSAAMSKGGIASVEAVKVPYISNPHILPPCKRSFWWLFQRSNVIAIPGAWNNAELHRKKGPKPQGCCQELNPNVRLFPPAVTSPKDLNCYYKQDSLVRYGFWHQMYEGRCQKFLHLPN